MSCDPMARSWVLWLTLYNWVICKHVLFGDMVLGKNNIYFSFSFRVLSHIKLQVFFWYFGLFFWLFSPIYCRFWSSVLPPKTSSSENQEHDQDISTNPEPGNQKYDSSCLFSIFSTFYGCPISGISFLISTKNASTRNASRDGITPRRHYDILVSFWLFKSFFGFFGIWTFVQHTRLSQWVFDLVFKALFLVCSSVCLRPECWEENREK